MKCPLCGLEFKKEIAESLCASACPIWKECDGMRCPNCYFENVLEPKWYQESAGMGLKKLSLK